MREKLESLSLAILKELAKENGIKTIIFPKENEQDLLEIPEEVKRGVNLIPVETYKEAYGRIFAWASFPI